MATVATIAPKIWRHAVDTFGTDERALRWMRYRSPNQGSERPNVFSSRTAEAMR